MTTTNGEPATYLRQEYLELVEALQNGEHEKIEQNFPGLQYCLFLNNIVKTDQIDHPGG
jgi:hypothetical protein